ncbi:hypothetical protein NIES2101_07410 [Calothrix sp. HK-06]|nr:hypothetical protein NIES2101_07410 [Calothrix sp. HK-06]
MKVFGFMQKRKKGSGMNKKSGNRTSNIKLKPGEVYIQDCVSNELSKLYALDLTTGKASFLGEIFTEVSDIAFVGSQLYGLDREGNKTKLVKIDINSGDAITIGDIGFPCAGLAYNRQRQILYATTAKQLIAINIETGKGTPAVTVAGKDYNCGEVAFDANGKGYITLISYDKKKLLASCNLDTGEVTIIGDIGFADVASLEFVDDVLYGVTGNFFKLGKDGQLIRINTKTGKGSLVTLTDPIGRWAGISIYEPATAVVPETTPKVKPEEKPEKTKVTQESKIVREENMSILTIDTKTNCYVIDANQMSNLQQNVATSFTFEKGSFEIRIAGGRYSYSKSKTQGEPFVLLWIYGDNGSTFVNKTTGFEVGATWTTLNGYNDTLKLEVKERAVLSALFFDFNNEDNGGSVDLLITSNKQFFNPVNLTVDSKRNCYLLDEKYLSTLKQSGSNSIELNPGNYRIKIHEGNASYWSDKKKFNIEPWALILCREGKFITKLTGIEIEETWVSLNGLKDEVTLEVKEKTTLTGLFFDTYKEDNEGQIILAIESITVDEITEKYSKQENNQVSEHKSEKTVTTGTVTTSESNGQSVGRELVGAKNSVEFTFRFNEEEFKKKWEEQLQQINTSINVTNKTDITLEAKYWDQLEQWLLRNYEKHFKNLSVEVAKVRFSMDAYLQQIEYSLNQQLQGWSGYLEKILEDRINVEISKKINQQINQYVDQTFEQRIRNNVGLIINNIVNRQELNQYIDRHVNQQIDNSFEQKIKNNVELIINNIVNKQELNQYIDRHVNQQIDNSFEQKIRNNVALIINNIVNRQELNQHINQQVNQQVDNSFEQNIRNNINLITQNLINNSTELNQYVNQQLDNSFEQNIRNNVNLITQSIINDNTELNQYVTQQVDNSFEQNIRNNVNLITQSIINDNTELNHYVTQQVDNSFEQNIRNNINLITQNIIDNNTELNQYVSQQVDNSFEQNIRNNVNLITQSIIDNNTELNQYFDQRVQQTVNNNTEVNHNIVNIVNNSTEINHKIESVLHQTFISLVTEQVDQLINVIGGREAFINLITQSIINNNTELNQYLDQRVQQSVNNNTEVNHNIVNIVNNSTEINHKIESVLHQTFISLVTEQVDQLINVIGGREAFINLITQSIVNNNTEMNQYVSQQINNSFEHNIHNSIRLITQNIINNNTELNQYVDQRLHHNVTNNNVFINQIFNNDQLTHKIQNIFIDNSQIHQKIESVVINSPEINNRILNFVVNSTEINNKINNIYTDVDIKIENIRNEWNQTFIALVRQYVDELITVIGSRESFNIHIANMINVKVDELLNQIWRIRNELTVFVNNSDRNLYEWTLGELMVIKGCLTDRQALVEQLVTFSSELRVKLDNTNCVDINTFKAFKPLSVPQQLPGNK